MCYWGAPMLNLRTLSMCRKVAIHPFKVFALQFLVGRPGLLGSRHLSLLPISLDAVVLRRIQPVTLYQSYTSVLQTRSYRPESKGDPTVDRIPRACLRPP